MGTPDDLVDPFRIVRARERAAVILAAQWTWRVFARQLGVLAPATVPWVVLALLVPVTVLLANVIALLPARTAARVQAARVLSAE